MFTKHVSAQLSAYINGELATDEAQRLREHLLVCKSCRAEYDEIKFGSQLAAQLPEVAAPSMLWLLASRCRESLLLPCCCLFAVLRRQLFSTGGGMLQDGKW